MKTATTTKKKKQIKTSKTKSDTECDSAHGNHTMSRGFVYTRDSVATLGMSLVLFVAAAATAEAKKYSRIFLLRFHFDLAVFLGHFASVSLRSHRRSRQPQKCAKYV